MTYLGPVFLLRFQLTWVKLEGRINQRFACLILSILLRMRNDAGTTHSPLKHIWVWALVAKYGGDVRHDDKRVTNEEFTQLKYIMNH